MKWISRLAVIALLAVTSSCTGCKPYVGPVAHIVVDCLAQDQGKLEALAMELLPLLLGGSPDWTTFKDKAIGAGVDVGGCVAADLIQKYLAPPPGNAAPSPENGQAARVAMDEIRAQFNGASFKTQAGTL